MTMRIGTQTSNRLATVPAPDKGGYALQRGKEVGGATSAARYEKDRAAVNKKIPLKLDCLAAVSQLSENSLVPLLAHADILELRPRDTLLDLNDCQDVIFLILDGVMSVQTHGSDGRQMIHDYLGRGEFFGEASVTSSDGLDVCVSACGGCILAQIPRDHFMEVAHDYPEIYVNILGNLVDRLERANQRATDLAFLDVTGRVKSTLFHLAKGPNAITHPDGMQVRITRQEIGLIVGCSREMVGRALKSLTEADLIVVGGKNIVVLGTR